MADRPPPRPAVPGRVQLLQLGATWGVCIGLGVLAGYLLDGVFGTTPLLVFAGLAVAIVVAATGSYQLIRPFLTVAPTRAPYTEDPDTEDAPNGASDAKE